LCKIKGDYRGFESLLLRHPSTLTGFGWQATLVDGTKGVSRSFAGAQGDCRRWRQVYFLELKNGDIHVARPTIFGVDSLLVGKGMSLPRAGISRSFFARMWRERTK
jgi:hypothetical protein